MKYIKYAVFVLLLLCGVLIDNYYLNEFFTGLHTGIIHLLPYLPSLLMLLFFIYDEKKELEQQNRKTIADYKDQQLRYSALLNLSPNGIWLLNHRLQTVETNDSLATMLGYQPNEIIGKLPYQFVAEEDKEDLIDILTSQLGSEELICKICWSKKNRLGILDSLTFVCGIFEQEQLRYILLIVIDKTDENRVKRQLRALNETLERKIESKTRYTRALLESQPNMILVINGDVIIDFNLAFRDFFSKLIPLSDDYKLPWNRIASLFEPIKEEGFVYDFEHVDLIAHLLANRSKTHKVVVRLGASVKTFNIDASYLEDLHDDSIGSEMIIITLSDITQIEAIRKDEINLAKLTSIGRLTAGITHEINTPLTYLKGNLELLGMDAEGLQDEQERQEIMEGIKECQEGVSRLENIIKTMREVVSQGSDKKEVFNLYESLVVAARMLLSRAKHISKIYIEDERVYLESSGENRNYPVYGFKQRMEQVWIVILNNALDELSHCSVPYEERYVQIEIEQKPDGVHVIIRDNAGGIPSDILERIFDPLSSTKTSSGMGLGLNIAHKIISDNHATIRASNDEFGAVFEVVMPSGASAPSLALD